MSGPAETSGPSEVRLGLAHMPQPFFGPIPAGTDLDSQSAMGNGCRFELTRNRVQLTPAAEGDEFRPAGSGKPATPASKMTTAHRLLVFASNQHDQSVQRRQRLGRTHINTP